MRWIGLTGGLGTGKSTVARLLLNRGIPVIDADLLAREVVETGSPGFNQIVKEFGAEVLTSERSLDRQKLAQIVFKNPKKLRKLEDIVHPLVQESVRQRKKWLEDQGTELAFYDVPLLFEKKLEAQFNAIIVVACTQAQQIQRIIERNHWTESEIRQRLKSQMPLEEKINRATYVIENNSDLPNLEKAVDKILDLLRP